MTRSRNSAPAPPKEPTPDLLPIHRTLLSEIRRSTRINTEAGPKEITIEEAVILQLIQTAVKKGSPHALGQLIRIAQKAQKQEAKRIAEEIAWGRERQERAFRELNHWTAVGRDPKMFFLHPDDIVITEGAGCDIIGPIDQEDLTEVLRRREERDALFVQATLEERLASKQEWIEAGENTQKKPGAMAWFMMHMIDSTLPARFRLTTLDLIRFDRIYKRMTKRELLKHTVAVWRKLGKRIPRGQRLTALHDMMPMIHAVYGTAGAMLKREKAGRPMELSEISRVLEMRINERI